MAGISENYEELDASELQSDSIEWILKDGRATILAGMMLERHQLFPGFLPLLIHPQWTVRLGAMVVLEEIAQVDSALAGSALDIVWKAYPFHDASVRGDVIYLIGEIGEPKWISVIEPLIGEEDREETRSVLLEAVAKLRKE